jgi:hypothetical protein
MNTMHLIRRNKRASDRWRARGRNCGRNRARWPLYRRLACPLALALCAASITCAACSGPLPWQRKRAQVWRVWERAFTAEATYSAPASDVQLDVIFTGPDGSQFTVPGFWDGGQTWRVRFTPTLEGNWSYVTRCSNPADGGLHNQQGSLQADAASGENPLYLHGGFMRVSENGRYLTYTDGTPFFWLGDTWWFCPSAKIPFEGSTNPEYESAFKTMVDTRAQQGYTVAHWAFQGPVFGADKGKASFIALAQQEMIDPSYWQQVDPYFDYANEAGLIPVIGLCFHSGGDILTLEQWQFLWRYVVARYGAHAVTWLITGEYNHKLGDPETRIPKMLALGQFIKDVDPYHRAMTVHPGPTSLDRGQAWDQPWYDLIMFQSGHVSYPEAGFYYKVYERDVPKPMVEGECNYEGIHRLTDADVRWSAYRAIQAGCTGYTYGAQGLWYPTQHEQDSTFDEWGERTTWWESLKRPGGAQMQHLRALYESVEWWRLEPQPDAVRVYGFSNFMMDPLVKADVGKTYVVYFCRGLKADFHAYLRVTDASPYQASWFNPRTGETTALDGQFAGQDGEMLLPDRPDDSDWVLVLRRATD